MEPNRVIRHRAVRRRRRSVPVLLGTLLAVLLAGCTSSPAAPPQQAARPSSVAPARPPVPQLIGGGTRVFPGRRMVALYGSPGTPSLGVLGEQGIPQSVDRAKKLAASYQPLVREPVVPAFELITTVASSSPGDDGTYSAELPLEQVRPWLDAAAKAGVYVVLDLQPGRADFLSQARRYESLLTRPNVGLALDPEWRLAPGQRPREQIGSVSAAEVNRTSAWLADLTRRNDLPQKVFMLHQFRVQMIPDRQQVVTSHPELATVLHADGFGPPSTKLDTWNTLHTAPAPRGLWWGWKNFVDEDEPMFTPAQTYAVKPTSPVFVSFQ